MYHLNIEIKEQDYKTKLFYEPGSLNENLKQQIKQNKNALIQRIKENKQAQDLGFLIYHHGLFYEYRYGRGAFLFIERLPNGKATSWRANYRQDETRPYSTKMIAENVPFIRAYEQAENFITWINKKRGKKVG
jgi:hypothetical protein